MTTIVPQRSPTSTPPIPTPPSDDSDSQRRPAHLRPSSPQPIPTSSSTSKRKRPPPSPLPLHSGATTRSSTHQASRALPSPSPIFASDSSDLEEEEDDDDDDGLASTMTDARPPMHRPTDGRSSLPLLKEERGRPAYDAAAHSSTRPAFHARRSTFRSRSPRSADPAAATRRKYSYAAFFLGLSLVSFVVQTETAVYIQHTLHWDKAYCMLYLTHGSWSLLWPAMLAMLRLQQRHVPWAAFWRRHVALVRSTAQMVQSGELRLTARETAVSPAGYMMRTTAVVTTALTVAGGSWYVAVNLTSASDLTAIYNCSAFFAYAFSIPLLRDKLRFDKIVSVGVAIAGVLIVAYGDAGRGKEEDVPEGCPGPEEGEAKNRLAGNVIIGVGSVLYGLYEVLYKKLACPPEGASPGRGMVFAMTVGSCIGCFTLSVLWIPLPVLHYMGWETFELPRGEAASMLLISVLANATFSGSFLVLISLTSPVLSSVAALLTIFLVAIVDWLLPCGQPLSVAAIIGGLLIIAAFLLLSWSTYREMNEEQRKKYASAPPVVASEGALSHGSHLRLADDPVESDSDDEPTGHLA